jgi:hypothetical protein
LGGPKELNFAKCKYRDLDEKHKLLTWNSGIISAFEGQREMKKTIVKLAACGVFPVHTAL